VGGTRELIVSSIEGRRDIMRKTIMLKKSKATNDAESKAGSIGAGWRERFNAMSPEELAAFDAELEAEYPGGFSLRDEANALIACAVRNGPIENLHAGKYSPLLEDPSLSRITDAEMKQIMLNATETLARLLTLREEDPKSYSRMLRAYGKMYCHFWER